MRTTTTLPGKWSKWKTPSLAMGFLLLVSAFSQQLIVGYFEAQISGEMRARSTELADGLINGMNMLMITGQVSAPENRRLLLEKMASSQGVDELRIIRAKQVQDQFGPGLPTEQAVDALDRAAIETKKPIFQTVELNNNKHQFRAVIPFVASTNFRGTNCLMCHHVQEGSVNGAASILLDMDEADEKLSRVRHWVWAGDAVFALMLALILLWRRADRRIQFLANYDPVTGLPNRNLLHDRLSQAINFAQRYDRMLGILFIDLDDFKTVNDSLGHHMGDRLLRQLGERLMTCVRGMDTVARLGGDEFVIAVTGLDHPDSLIFVAEKVLDSLSRPFILDDHELFISSSIGIAVFPRDGGNETTLLKNADSAMYHAKERGKRHFQFYSSEMNHKARERLSLINDLHRALERDELLLHYQPQINLKTGEITGVEALIRWKHPQHGMVPPMKFIPLAEETRLILPIGEWILHTACTHTVDWHKRGFKLSVAINLSPLQVEDQGLQEMVADALSNTGMNPEYLELELTENILIQRPEVVYKIFRQLRAKGVRLAIDDFGTGYSSLNYLSRLPIDKLKIDKSFIPDIANDPNDRSIVEAIISMAHSLRLKAIAEGVEAEDQAEFLRRLNCDEAQGYLFGKPVSKEKMDAILAARVGQAKQQYAGAASNGAL
jgi:diguanylate cyclase (GGDEF)-like protein